MATYCEELNAEIVQIYQEIQQKAGVPFRFKIEWSTQMTTAAGAAVMLSAKYKTQEDFLNAGTIKLNWTLFSNPKNRHELKETIIHEAAHLLAGIKHGHDETWARYCRELGGTPKRCHNMDGAKELRKKRGPKKKYKVICSECDIEQVATLAVIRRIFNGAKYHHNPRNGCKGIMMVE